MPRALVLDQNTKVTGYSVVEDDKTAMIYPGFPGKLIAYGRIIIPAEVEMADVLMTFRADLRELIVTYKPKELVLENTNPIQRSRRTSNVMGALVMTCQDVAKAHGLDFYMQSPKKIKKIFAQDGDASKEQMIASACHFFGLHPSQIKDDNVADALGGGFAWLYRGDEVRAEKAKKKAKKT